jgi:hypothetical protein
MSIRSIAISIAGLLIVAVPAFAQTGRICGTVTAPSGTGVEGVVVTVSLRAHDTQPRSSPTKTDAKGDYHFSSLVDGVYSLSFTRDGFKKVVRSGVLVRAGFVPRTDQRLEASAVWTPLLPEARPITFTGDRTIGVSTAPAQSQLSCGPTR